MEAVTKDDDTRKSTAVGTVATTQWAVSLLRENGVAWTVPEAVVAAGIAALGLLMVSAVPYRSFKEVQLRASYRTLVLTVIAFAVILSKPSVTLFLVGIAYVSSGPIEWLWRVRTGRPLEEIEETAEGEGRAEESEGSPT